MELSGSLGYLVNRLAHHMALELDAKMKPHGITISQWTVMNVLWRREGLSQVEIQEALAVEGSTVSGLIQRMLKSDLIRRSPDPQDGRVMRIYLTDRGRALEPELTEEALNVNRKTLQGLSPDEQQFLIRLLSRAIRNYEL